METVNAIFALITGMALSVGLALLLENAMLRGVMRLISSPMMARARSNRVMGPSSRQVI